MKRSAWVGAVLSLILVSSIAGAGAADLQDFSTAYTITIQENGDSLWKVEYRTPLATDQAVSDFQTYSDRIASKYLPELQNLMQSSAREASAATSRPMAAGNFVSDADILSSPTGKIGRIAYTFEWTNFATTQGGSLAAGDAFAGGMYLGKDTTLSIRYPDGYTVTSAPPAAVQKDTTLSWSGPYTFSPGEPRVDLKESSSAWFIPVLIAAGLLPVAVVAIWILQRRRKTVAGNAGGRQSPAGSADDPEETDVAISEHDLRNGEEIILGILAGHGGGIFQSEIVKISGLPKSTVSTTLNKLHKEGVIQKVRKGRENLIRMVKQ